MIQSPKYGQTVYVHNLGVASATPFLSGKIDTPKMIDGYWSVKVETGRRKLFTNDELFETMDELIKEG